jgi:acetyl-CoA acyltransferase
LRPNSTLFDRVVGNTRPQGGRPPFSETRAVTMSEAVICDGVRTPIGRYGGALSQVRTDDLAAIPIRALLARNPSLAGDAIDEVLLGDANQAGEDNRNVARMAALLAGLPVSVPGVTLNRLCASGMDAVGFAARGIRAGDYAVTIAGGVESMTRAPFVMPKPGSAWSRETDVFDTTIGWRFVNPAMREAYGTDSMPQTADNVAEDFGISRADQDAFALRSQERWARADAAGVFADEIAPVTIPRRKGEPTVVDRDEHPRPDTTAEALAKLRGINGAGADGDGGQCLGRQ